MFKRMIPLLTRQLNLPFCVRILLSDLTNQCFVSTCNRYFPIQKPFAISARGFAKTKDKKKDTKKKVIIDENELAEVFNVQKLYEHLKEPIDVFKENIMVHATLRSSAHAFENLKITYENEEYKLQDLAEIAKKSDKMYVIDLSCFPGAAKTVFDTLQKSEMNLNVQQEGLRIFVPIPKVTKEHRENLVKKCKAFFVTCKNSIRSVEHKYAKKLENVKNLSTELQFSVVSQLNELGNQHIQSAEKILKEKEKELLKTN